MRAVGVHLVDIDRDPVGGLDSGLRLDSAEAELDLVMHEENPTTSSSEQADSVPVDTRVPRRTSAASPPGAFAARARPWARTKADVIAASIRDSGSRYASDGRTRSSRANWTARIISDMATSSGKSRASPLRPTTIISSGHTFRYPGFSEVSHETPRASSQHVPHGCPICRQYCLGDAIIRQVGGKWIAIVADVQFDGDFATREDAWHAVGRYWTDCTRGAVERWKRMQGGR